MGEQGAWNRHVEQMLTRSEQADTDNDSSGVHLPTSFPVSPPCSTGGIAHHPSTPSSHTDGNVDSVPLPAERLRHRTPLLS